MKIFNKQAKGKDGEFYFGDYDAIDISISYAHITPDSLSDSLHYHKKAQEYYIVIAGTGLLEVEGHMVELQENTVVMVEPGEKHRIIAATSDILDVLVIATPKIDGDKVMIGN